MTLCYFHVQGFVVPVNVHQLTEARASQSMLLVLEMGKSQVAGFLFTAQGSLDVGWKLLKSCSVQQQDM